MIQEPKRVPLTALLLSIGALAVPILGVVAFTRAAAEYELLLWLLALVPAFLLAYHRGWVGAATGAAAAMAAFALAQAVLAATGRELQTIGRSNEVIIMVVVVTIGVGWLADRLLRERSKAQQLALIDSLTDLPNRRYLELFLRSNFAAAQRGRTVSAVLFDIDQFKEYNDKYGHAAGDAVLRQIAFVMASLTRGMDLCGRWGGEEFLAILSDNGEDGASVYAERVRRAIAEIPLDDPVTVSAGVAPYRPYMAGPDDLAKTADQALYRAKQEGRNCVRRASDLEPDMWIGMAPGPELDLPAGMPDEGDEG